MAATAELEHFCGYGGHHFDTVRYHPVQTNTLVYGAGAAIIVEDVTDPHKQQFLRGHDNEVSCLDISANGRLLASGQIGSPCLKGALAPVVVWDFEQRQRLVEFGGITQAVLSVRLSPDGRFLAAAGGNQMLFIWDVSTSEVVYSRRTENPCSLLVWGPILDTGGRYPAYQLCTAYDSLVLVHQMTFDIRSMCYTLSSDPMQLPATGMQRKHMCGLVHDGFLVTGTSAGDMCVFSTSSKVFRAALPVCNNGVSSVCMAGGVLFAAGGDGRVKAMRGNDAQWDVLTENMLEGGVMALTVAADCAELVAGCRNGKMFRLLASDLTATLQAVTHTDEVTSVAFSPSSGSVCTASKAGEIFLLDLSDYMPITVVPPQRSAANSVALSAGSGEIIAGYEDGMVRCWSANSGTAAQQPRWELQAHRGGVTTVRESKDFVATGGNDCAVRVWHRTTRELLLTFTNHRKPVADLLLDTEQPHLVHSGSEDKLVITYDIKQSKPLVQHFTHQCMVTGLSQRKDRDKELVSCSLDGKLLFWDEDYPDPRGQIEICSSCGSRARLRCVDVSPSGRYIATGAEDARLYIYDLMAQSCILECEGHSGEVCHVKWSPDQKQLVTAGKDGCVIVWNFFEA